MVCLEHDKGLTLQKRQVSLAEPCKSLICGSKRVKSPSCLSRSVRPAASIRDKKILQQWNDTVKTRRRKRSSLWLSKHVIFLTWRLRFSPEVGTCLNLLAWAGSSLDGGHRCFLLCFHGSSKHSQCRQPAYFKILRDSSLPLGLLMENVSAIT